MTIAGPPSITDRFTAILEGCCAAVAESVHLRGVSALLAQMIFGRLKRTIKRFVLLACRIREGTLKPPRQRAAGGSKDTPANPRPPDPFPRRRHGWVVDLAGDEVGHVRSELEHMLRTDPEMARLIAADPHRMGRILRPLCRMLGVELPETLRLPPRARKRVVVVASSGSQPAGGDPVQADEPAQADGTELARTEAPRAAPASPVVAAVAVVPPAPTEAAPVAKIDWDRTVGLFLMR